MAERAVGPFIITTEDARMFYCSIERDATAEPRWMLIDSDGVEYAGPRYVSEDEAHDVRRVVSAWWRARE